MASPTYESPDWPCPECGGTERYTKGLRCVACNPRKAPAVLQDDPLKALEDEAWREAEEMAEENGSGGKDRQYANLGTEYAKPFRAAQLREWPIHTDFRPDNLKVRD